MRSPPGNRPQSRLIAMKSFSGNDRRLTMLDSDIEPPVQDEAPPPPPARRRRRVRALLGGTAVLAIGAVCAVWVLQDGSSAPDTKTSNLPTVSVVRTNMTNTTDIDGTLGYSDSYTVLAGGSGVVTWVPTVGEVIERGKRAYGLDGRRIPLFYG